ncbi:MAG TPA: class I SAM-dependent methyltransferase [Vicinamibacteria bacterium]|nr:class I SAM-dependent methyltransferase [Vicinamibacteria bacterium]
MHPLKLAPPLCVLATLAAASDADLDQRVQEFLWQKHGTWHEWNVPEQDGRILHDLVLKHGFTRALEIGTSTGHSGIWIAWALAKTGGRLTTVEIDRERHDTAVANFRQVGLLDRIDARLGDAHTIVPALRGPFDFVFSDADKDWYLRYFEDLEPKLTVGGCFAAHNVLRGGGSGAAEFVAHVESLPNYRTTIETGSGEGISISCKLGGDGGRPNAGR